MPTDEEDGDEIGERLDALGERFDAFVGAFRLIMLVWSAIGGYWLWKHW